MPEIIIDARGIVKKYGEITAVDNVDLAVAEGTCLGLLGPNGAGKTTLIEIMEGIRKPTRGQVFFRGNALDNRYKERVGIQFQQTALQEYITVEETLRTFGSLYPRTRPLEELVAICNLQDIWRRDNRKLSGGQRQRMLLALALVNDPELIFLDEPTTGLDPQARRNFWELIRRVKAEGRTVVLTTHYMEEAELLADEIAIMDHGQIIARGTPKELLEHHFQGVIIRLPANASAESLPESAKHYPTHVDIPTTEVDRSIRALLEDGQDLEGLSIHSPNLDDLFLELTGSSLRDEAECRGAFGGQPSEVR